MFSTRRLVLIALLLSRAPLHGDEPPFTKRVPLTTSRVVGSPDPPPPYRVAKVYPELQPLANPEIAIHQPGSDRILLISLDKPGQVTHLYRFKDEPGVKEKELILDLTDQAYQIVFHPRFAENGYFYVGSNGAAKKDEPKKTRVTRYTMERTEPFKVDPASAKVIIEWDSNGHNGGAVAFGHDGMFYVTSGDGTSDSDTNIVGQEMSTLLSKVLRIDVDHPEPGKTYAVPKDNPFVNLAGARPEIWAYGLRAPWRMTVDAKTGHLWVAQNGQDLFEQAFLVKKGDNYGWSVTEGSSPFYLQRKRGPTPIVLPTVEHSHAEARSLTGGIVYHGEKHPDLRGAYLYGDYSTGKIWGVKHDGTKVVWHREIADTRKSITGFGTDSKGEILICDFRPDKEGGIYTLVPTPPGVKSTFPKTLSESGLFRSVKGHVMEPALVPYSVNAVLWSDGAGKERWLGLPGEETFAYHGGARSWNFPDLTVIVKSFFLEMEDGNPQSRRWIETRFLTRQEGEWFGYSYAWDDAQTEGTLIAAAGQDREYTIRGKDGDRKQVWHYPSRTECMVCHSRAANWVLGLSEGQLNKEHDYGGGVRENQLEVFERLELFRRKGAAKKPPVKSSLPPAEKRVKLVDPYDAKEDLTLRVRSYLHSNCAQCHVEAGGGNSAMELGFNTPLEKTRLLGVAPKHDAFGLKDAMLVRPGHPESSVLLHRLAHRDKGFMPPLATRDVDRRAVDLIREWITKLPE